MSENHLQQDKAFLYNSPMFNPYPAKFLKCNIPPSIFGTVSSLYNKGVCKLLTLNGLFFWHQIYLKDPCKEIQYPFIISFWQESC